MQTSQIRELWIIVSVAAAALILGGIFGHSLLALGLALSFYLGFTLYHLTRLHRWLLSKKQGELPEAGGLWGEVFNEIHQLEKEAVRHRELLHSTATRFQEAASALPDGIVIVSQPGDIEWANPAAARMLGVRYPQDSGQRIDNLVRSPEFIRYLKKADYSEVLELAAPGRPDIQLALQVVPYGSQQRLLVARDVTHVVQLEHMRQNFIANASHELRSPITVLLGYLETLQRMPDAMSTDTENALSSMHEQAQRMERLVADLLMLTRLETTPVQNDEVVDVAAMLGSLKESAEFLSKQAQHTIRLNISSTVQLRGNREQLHSVFMNLIDNAVRYTPPSGTIYISWEQMGKEAVFSVRDTGVGIAPQHIAHLTERFYRVDADRSRETGGTGLGLAIVKHILSRHEAKLLIESTPAEGSTFSCRFPAHRLVSVAAAAHQ